MNKSLAEIEDELDELQALYLDEDDEVAQLEIEMKFSHKLEEATSIDGVLRSAAGVTINNWSRETTRED